MTLTREPAEPVHPAVVRLLHWLTLPVLLAAFVLVLMHQALADKALRLLSLDAHRLLGLLAWLLALARLTARWRTGLADTMPDAPRWQRGAAAAGHAALYLLLLSLPLLGWALSNARGRPVNLPGLGSLPAWPGRDLDLADSLESWHAGLAWTMAALVASHAAVALWHHRVRRDPVLRAMLPRLAKTTVVNASTATGHTPRRGSAFPQTPSSRSFS